MHEHKILVRYIAEMLGTFFLYALVLVLVHRFGFPMHEGIVRTLVLLSPMVPVLLMIGVVARYFRRVDEYIRLKFLENWAMTAAITAGWTFTYGFLENAGLPRLSMFNVMPMMGAISAVLFIIRRMVGR
jgi:hypothetical protein